MKKEKEQMKWDYVYFIKILMQSLSVRKQTPYKN